MTDWIQSDDALLAMIGETLRWHEEHFQGHDAQWQALVYDGTVVAVRCMATWPDGARCNEVRLWPWAPVVGFGGQPEQHARYVEPRPPAGSGRGYSDDRVIIDETRAWTPSIYGEARQQYEHGRGEWGHG